VATKARPPKVRTVELAEPGKGREYDE
jgi:hypothetical protein